MPTPSPSRLPSPEPRPLAGNAWQLRRILDNLRHPGVLAEGGLLELGLALWVLGHRLLNTVTTKLAVRHAIPALTQPSCIASLTSRSAPVLVRVGLQDVATLEHKRLPRAHRLLKMGNGPPEAGERA